MVLSLNLSSAKQGLRGSPGVYVSWGPGLIFTSVKSMVEPLLCPDLRALIYSFEYLYIHGQINQFLLQSNKTPITL